MNISGLKIAVLFLLLLPLLACGGGGGGTPTPATVAQKVELTVGLQGSGTVGAVDLEIELPKGFPVFALEIDGEICSTEEELIEFGSRGLMGVNHIGETPESNGMLLVSIIHPDGLAVPADLFKVSGVYAAGASLPTVDDFEVFTVAFEVSNDNDPMPEVTAIISLTITQAP